MTEYTGAQCRVKKAKDGDTGAFFFSVKMGDNSKISVLGKKEHPGGR